MITGIVVALLLAVIVFQYMIIKIDKDKRHEAGHDKLTGLCNPEHLMQKMKELPDKKKNRLIIYSDIAEFKLINEIFGIEKGNEILLKQADIIKKHAVDGYLYGRVGEDHFVVIADEATFNEEYLYECRETLQNVLSDSVYNVRVCFGIYRTDNMNESLSFMCDKASFAVASIKDDTHSFIAYYDDTMLEAAIKYKTIVDEFDDAIKAGEFKMYLQPQISAKTRRLTGAEALVRWRRSDGIIVPPYQFVPLFERNGFINKVDRYMFELVCRQQMRWLKQGLLPVPISVNMSRMCLYDPHIVDEYIGVLNVSGLSAAYIKLELTESAFFENISIMNNVIEALHKVGIKVLMDDFGTGYSSMMMLKNVAIDVLKLDKSFVDDIGDDRSEKIISNIIYLAHSLQIEVTAEGVETAAQFEFLKSVGCDYIQGYYFGKPQPAEDFAALLQKEFYDGSDAGADKKG